MREWPKWCLFLRVKVHPYRRMTLWYTYVRIHYRSQLMIVARLTLTAPWIQSNQTKIKFQHRWMTFGRCGLPWAPWGWRPRDPWLRTRKRRPTDSSATPEGPRWRPGPPPQRPLPCWKVGHTWWWRSGARTRDSEPGTAVRIPPAGACACRLTSRSRSRCLRPGSRPTRALPSPCRGDRSPATFIRSINVSIEQ